MSHKKLVVARVYDDRKDLIGCGVYSSKTNRTECKSIKDIIKMIRHNEIDNMKIGESGRVEGLSYGAQEFNNLTAVRYAGGNKVIVIEPRIYILSFKDKKEFPIIKPDGGSGVIKARILLSMLENDDVKPSNFVVMYGEIVENPSGVNNNTQKTHNDNGQQVKANSSSSRDTVKESGMTAKNTGKASKDLGIQGMAAFAEVVVDNICKIISAEKMGKCRLETRKGYQIYIGTIDKGNGLSVEIEKSVDVEKYASTEKYGFIFREYDNTCHIMRDYAPEEYDKVINRHKSKFIKFNTGITVLTEVKEGYYLSLEDKDWLTVEYGIKFKIPIKDKKSYSTKDVSNITDVMLSILGWG